ncbi:30S ribosomal protein S16 [bacterium (Candidatus Blackallbacteria) CG17_big_fil_post_rev_8_21_14_2_50_48_46]|uniref:Small ribosomal subunit protein bS16 n=1 Tax=bacterium (Candidatus Blackallbacteria) CG17_big_fil_post_rev_8_21_14_2_50_48_46 TaxID=2014261 RepID=A0A2M7G3V7_9BACT|nr:MAG: 30S ribosomal protein S16 [bacterium (Candidatus Blackallbacteria) CG18_big_fil_WC_8_21_14_2_50_49_26]PIW16543.1 MAG: 30S ribosomal protein S16 [bacterium (Candidatus Blackallbacteria) CG17_big_fil_post_rev_8_21_14_2_50_48_46]PIW46051.1 MAG: 30S ribosomal protein S16 [bacterium (Candidatus Blackallbacteria) CG13_big_fil_rev_8_21_14_2_50_49_14]
MVKIRLKRFGTKKRPVYRVVVIDSRSRRDGRPIEEIGFYDPRQEPSIIRFKEDSLKKWLDQGAQPTDVVERLIKQAQSA